MAKITNFTMKINENRLFSEFFTKNEGAERKIDFLILHHVEADSVNHAIQQFKEFEVSSHFLIAENGEIFELVHENDIAYHAGVSSWRDEISLNKNSIGIEFINQKPFEKNFTKEQLLAGVDLCKYLIKKHHILPQNILGHSDIAFDRETDLLDRKQDPSHFFDWKFLAQNGVGIFPNITLDEDKILFKEGDKDKKIRLTKEKLAQFGYKLNNLNDEFNDEMALLARVFNRHFNQEKFLNNTQDFWHLSSEKILDELILAINFA